MRRTFGSVIALCLASGTALACAQEAEDSFAIGPGSAPVASDDPSGVADRAVDDVTAFWEETYPELYGDAWRPVAGFYPYGPDTEPPPCGEPPPQYEEIANNAFYCPGADIIAYDVAQLLPELNESFGAFTIGIVIAHEYGHAVQDRVGDFDRTIDLELQADCFAGAWTARVADGEAEGFSPEDVDLDSTVAGMIAIRDVPGTSPDDPFAHGSGFDRVAAFQDGYENTAEVCVGYADESEDRRTAEIPFTPADFEGGNFPLHDDDPGAEGRGLFTLIEADLNEFYEWYFGELGEQWTPVASLVLADPATDEVTCGGESLSGDELDHAALYCVGENIVVIDDVGLVPALNEIGDFAVGIEVAQLWAVAAQDQLGIAGNEEADLQAICLSGYWSASLMANVFPDVQDVTPGSDLGISAGDLDEAIMGFLAYGQSEHDGTVFDRVSALRTGMFGNLRACEDYGPLG